MADSSPNRQNSKNNAIDRAVTMQSVQQLILDAEKPDLADHCAPIPAPKEFVKKTASLEKLRQADAWKQDNRDLQVMQMAEWFPSIPHSRKDGAVCDDQLFAESTKQEVIKEKKEMVDDSIFTTVPTSDIGMLATLPGEIRNHIYRFAVLQSQQRAIEITLKPFTCASGACLHTRTEHNVPALAQTCAQLRSEVLSIFIAENSGFRFDAGSTRQRCIGNWLRSLGSFADRVPEITFTVKRWLSRAVSNHASYLFVITVPGQEMNGRAAEEFEMRQSAGKWQLCHCRLRKVLKNINAKWTAGEKKTGKLLEEFVDSDELAHFAWQLKDFTPSTWHLPKCKECGAFEFKRRWMDLHGH